MANQWEGRSKGTPLGYKIFISLLKLGGLPLAYKLLPFVTFWYRVFSKKSTAPLKYLYTQRLLYPEKTAKKLIAKNLNIFGQTLLDKIALMSGIPNNLSVTRNNNDAIQKMIEGGKGGFIISAHLGNYQAAGHMLKRYNTKVNVVMYDNEVAAIEETLKEAHQNRSFNVIPITHDGSHIFEIKAALSKGELICINADRYREGNRTLTTSFLGKDAQFPLGPFVLATKLGAPATFTFAIKQDLFQYFYKAYEAPSYQHLKGIGQQQAMLEDFVFYLEKEIKEHPEQWFNYYPFWKESL